MTVYSGVVTRVSSGTSNSNAAGVTHVKREYVDIGDAHLRNIVVDQYLDDHLRDACRLGGEVKLSVFKLFGFGSRVLALRMPDGTVRKSDAWWFMLGNRKR